MGVCQVLLDYFIKITYIKGIMIAVRCQKCKSESGSGTTCYLVVQSNVFNEKDFKYCPLDGTPLEWEDVEE